ncbi:MAG: glycosyl transferase [Phycisphaeraceae bacterium]|nr:MAG: glycosyl transferase [Phycisphaeraceae bacterium]
MVLAILELVAGGCAVAVLAPALVFAVEVALALLPGRQPRETEGERPRLAVVIPAHDEAEIIAATVRTVLDQLGQADRVVVVADNCSDATADRAREAGARIVERTDTDHRGKGYALAAGVAALAEDPPGVVVILDADCEPEPGAIDAIARQAVATGRPAQAEYLMRPPTDATVGDRVSALAFRFKNSVRPRGLARVGAPCLLTGSGMAFGYETIRDATLATGDIVEDMRLGVDLAIAGKPPSPCPGARVWSVLPGSDDARVSQRTRWEHGHLASMGVHAPRLVWNGLVRERPGLIALALELCVPPMSLLVIATSGVVIGTGIVALVTGNWVPAIIAACALGFCAAGFAAGWARFGRDDLPARELWQVPAYAIGKIPIYLRALTSRQKAWVRTARDPASDSDACTR